METFSLVAGNLVWVGLLECLPREIHLLRLRKFLLSLFPQDGSLQGGLCNLLGKLFFQVLKMAQVISFLRLKLPCSS